MSGFTDAEADTLAGPSVDGLRNGGLLKEAENCLNDAMSVLRRDDVGRLVIPTLIERITRAYLLLSETQLKDARMITAALGPVADFGVDPTAEHFVARAAALCNTVIARDKQERPQL